MELFRPFRKDRQRRQGGSVSLYVNDKQEHIVSLGMDEELTESRREGNCR